MGTKGLAKTKLSRSVLDAAFGEFVRGVGYKAAWNFGRTVKVGRFFPSTKLCSECGTVNPNLTLSETTWLCGCGARHDRDLNASRNILAEGTRLLAAGQTDNPNARGGPVSPPGEVRPYETRIPPLWRMGVSIKDAMSAATTPLKVMLVEDQAAFRHALAYLLSDEPELEVVAQAGSVAEAKEALEGGDLDRALDVAVLDLALPDGDGRELIGELRRSSPGVRIMVLSATVWAADVEEVLRAGADAVHDKVRPYSTIAEEVKRLAGR